MQNFHLTCSVLVLLLTHFYHRKPILRKSRKALVYGLAIAIDDLVHRVSNDLV